MKKKYIFWDFNGTILDDRDLCFNILNEMLEEFNRDKVTLKDYLMIFDFPVKNYYAKIYDLEETPFHVLSHRFMELYQPRSMHEQLHQGVIDSLFYFQSMGVKNILLSASEKSNLDEQIAHFGISHYFDDILGTHNAHGESKLEVAKQYVKTNHIKGSDAVIIGDTLHDAEVGEALGFDIILYTKGHQHKSRLKKYKTIDNLYELSNIINKKIK
ncbi:MAG: HAD hydrolase-like protein [Acholeplasmataceae bacterium]